ncbi:TfuA-like protein [Streptomyces sp. NBC_00201]|uniref:TfuA-like protein n=1 Tax=unclassified Streptomyces TaxID=2593676 RepID=UPI002250A6C5|nr:MULTISPECIES: TfuA-like protein [unclassified Streptomyces]MCX5063730.1 TfuA-like protein [Streptomyces sp. NBC_00452]MCX5251885.1 TfuA-like protein [Streptomyces sp. NBC_00201]MCX5294212.1 TfuA-like protein [Streptomyces sp. NBC_00183]
MIHVYVGPTLPPDEPLLADPAVRVLPPARHGDLFDPAIADTDTVVLLDGLYHQAAALRHKEILAALARGVRVIGAASIGALRAAELHRFGMQGVGSIFRRYLTGELTGDDEVAVGQAPDGDRQALTWPLVNLRHVLDLAEQDGIVSAATATVLLEEFRAVYYPQRTESAIRAICHRHYASALMVWLPVRRTVDPHFGDLKRLDALKALRTGRSGIEPLLQARADALHWDTPYLRRWHAHFAAEPVDGLQLPTSLRIAYQQIFDPDFPQLWHEHLDQLSRHPGDGEAEMPLAERMGRLTGNHSSPLPVHVVFRIPVDVRDENTVTRLLANESAPDRTSLARCLAANEEARRTITGFMPETVKDAEARHTLQQLWRCPTTALEDAAAARGFRGAAHALDTVKVFMAGLLDEQAQSGTEMEAASDAH